MTDVPTDPLLTGLGADIVEAILQLELALSQANVPPPYTCCLTPDQFTRVKQILRPCLHLTGDITEGHRCCRISQTTISMTPPYRLPPRTD